VVCCWCSVEVGEARSFFSSSPLPAVCINVARSGLVGFRCFRSPSVVLMGEELVFLYECRHRAS